MKSRFLTKPGSIFIHFISSALTPVSLGSYPVSHRRKTKLKITKISNNLLKTEANKKLIKDLLFRSLYS